MTEQNSSESQATYAYGAFPRMSLSRILEIPEAIYELGQGERVYRLTVFDHLKRSPTSGTTSAMMAAANTGYGLVIGSISSEHLELTDLGKRVVAAKNPTERLRAIYEALFSNRIFAELVNYFNQKQMPRKEVGEDYLRREHGLSESDAETCFGVFEKNLLEHGLVKEYSGKPMIVTPELAIGRRESTPAPRTEREVTSQLEPEAVKPSGIKIPVNVPQIHLNIQIHLPESAEPEIYDAIFRSISQHLLKDNE